MTFDRERLNVNGVDITMLTAGQGEPLLFLHGAGTAPGFDSALPWAQRFRVMIPYHPGWGESADAPEMKSPDDYALHYLELIDQLKLDKVNLAGISMGGRLAATFTIHHRRRVRKLVLICPAGLVLPEHPMPDLSKLGPEELASYLVHDVNVLLRTMPAKATPEFQAARQREAASFARMIEGGLFGHWLERWCHRINLPTLIVWGDKDRLIHPAYAQAWAKIVPNSQVMMVPNVGHLVPDESSAAAAQIADFLS